MQNLSDLFNNIKDQLHLPFGALLFSLWCGAERNRIGTELKIKAFVKDNQKKNTENVA